jgi:signal transduction histidine kinase
MKTFTRFRSPFFILASGLLFACSGKDKAGQKNNAAAFSETLLAKSQIQNYTLVQRLGFASKAYTSAIRFDKDTLIGRAFYAKKTLLDAIYPDSSFVFLNQYANISQTRKDSLNLGNAYRLLGNHYFDAGQSDRAFGYFNAAKTIYETRRDSIQVIYSLLRMADIYRQYNDYIELERVSTDALRFLNPATSKTYGSIIYNNLGTSAKGTYSYKNALSYYRQSIAASQNTLAKIIATGNTIDLYNQTHNYKAAENTYLKLAIDTNAIDAKTRARLLGNYGQTRLLSGEPDGIPILLESEKIRKSINDPIGLVSSDIHLAEAFTHSDPSRAKDYALQAYRIATAVNSPDDRIEALQLIVANTGGNSAKTYFNAFINIQDSIQHVRQSARNQFAKIRYDSHKEKEENQELKTERVKRTLQLEKRKRLNDILYIIVIFIVAMGIMLFLLLRKRHRREKIREAYNAETRIAKKVHDELANDVFHTMTFAEMQDLSDANKKETLLSNLDSIYARSRDISRENNLVDTGQQYIRQLREMLSEYNSPELNVIIHGLDGIDWEALSDDKKIMTYRVLQELMVNMRKHSGAALAAIRFKKLPGKITVDYSDNGKGMPSEKVIFRNGLQNVENRINGIGGTVTFDSEPNKGLRISFSYPA